MADKDGAEPQVHVPEPAVWGREPHLVSLEIATWEHAACVPGSWGRAERVADLKRLLPHHLTAPIYELMARAEALFLRRTEPLPPFRERLARDFQAHDENLGSGDVPATPLNGLTLEGELRQILPELTPLSRFVPMWNEQLAAALGSDAPAIAARVRNFANLGLPQAEFPLGYGYKLQVQRRPGFFINSMTRTHGTLLMGCTDPIFQPGRLREVTDELFG